MRKFLAILLAILLLLSLGSTVLAADEPALVTAEAPLILSAPKDIVILHTNDVHGEYKANIGYAGLAAYKAEMEQSSYVALVDAGDFTQGAAISILSKGEYLVDIVNKVGYDVVVPGNHEFDYGIEQALKNLEAVDAIVLSCNFKDLRTDESVFNAFRLMTFGAVKVAFVGITTPETYTKSTPTYFMDADGNYIYSFSEGEGFYATIQEAVDAARAEGADYVVAVAHAGIDPESEPWTSTSIIANTNGIDVLIDGHSHSKIENEQVLNKDGKAVVLAQTGEKLNAIGKVTIAPDGTIRAELISDYAEKDAEVEQYITDEIEAGYQEYTSQVIAESAVELNGVKASVRTGETNMGDLIADAYRIVMGADIGMMNGGGIRASIAAGDVKIDDILAVMTFGNMATVKKISGQQIKDCLEMGVSAYPSASGGFTHVSGLTYCVDPDTPNGIVTDEKGGFDHVEGEYRVYNIKVNGEALDLDKIYTVACHSYWLNSYGDGMNMFKEGETVSEKHEIYVDNVMLVKYIQENLNGVIGEEYAEAQGRIVIDPFSDVLASAWFAPYVTELYASGVVNGMSETAFAPQAQLSYGQALKLLLVNGGELEKEAAVGEDWLANTMSKALELGLVEADNDGTDEISRLEFCRIAAKFGSFEEVSESVFSDCDDGAVNALAAAGVVNGFGDGSFAPEETLTRAQAAKILCVMNELAA